jgi:hypothetical protein
MSCIHEKQKGISENEKQGAVGGSLIEARYVVDLSLPHTEESLPKIYSGAKIIIFGYS